MHPQTVPALACNAPVSASGIITVTWSYLHTGGLPLTNVSVMYTFTNGIQSITNPVSVSGVDTTSVEVADLIVGTEYTFNVTAENSNGSSYILCGPTLHVIGESVTIRCNTLSNFHALYRCTRCTCIW